MTKKFKFVAIGGYVTLLGRPDVILQKTRLHRAISGDDRTSLNAIEVRGRERSGFQIKAFVSPEASVKVVKKPQRA